MKKKTNIREWIKAIAFAVAFILFIRVFIIEAFTIPSASMEKALLTGDYVLVNKLSYGPRIPITPLSFPFVHQQFPFTENTPSFLDWIQIPYTRLFGSPDIERNDIVVFNYPMENELPIDQRTHYVKRCVAISGDTLLIKDGKVIINNKQRRSISESSRWTFLASLVFQLRFRMNIRITARRKKLNNQSTSKTTSRNEPSLIRHQPAFKEKTGLWFHPSTRNRF